MGSFWQMITSLDLTPTCRIVHTNEIHKYYCMTDWLLIDSSSNANTGWHKCPLLKNLVLIQDNYTYFVLKVSLCHLHGSNLTVLMGRYALLYRLFWIICVRKCCSFKIVIIQLWHFNDVDTRFYEPYITNSYRDRRLMHILVNFTPYNFISPETKCHYWFFFIY